MSKELLNEKGRWLDEKTCEWGDWQNTEALLDELDIKHLIEAHYPYKYKSERAMTVKKATISGKPILQLYRELSGLRGYSLRSLQTDAIALSRAKQERDQQPLRNY